LLNRAAINKIKASFLELSGSESHHQDMAHDDLVILIFLLIAVLMGGIILAGVLILVWRDPQNKK
jgi:hypothetical protein